MGDHRRNLAHPIQGTCDWFLEHPAYRAWLGETAPGVLLLTGEAGTGKSILSSFIIDDLRAIAPSPPSHAPAVVYFFCDDKVETQRTATAVLRGVLHQILSERPDLLRRHTYPAFEKRGHELLRSFDGLWDQMFRIASDPSTGKLIVVIDALDECDESRVVLFQTISEYVARPEAQTFRFFLTSRPGGSSLYRKGSAAHVLVPMESRQADVDRSIGLMINHRVHELVSERGFSENTRALLLQHLTANADATFLWADLVLDSLSDSSSTALSDVRKILETLPPKLDGLYSQIVRKWVMRDEMRASRLLQFIVGALKPLSLNELNALQAVRVTDLSPSTLDDNLHMNMQMSLRAILGPLVRIVDSTVYLVHQSAKDFLLAGTHHQLTGLPRHCHTTQLNADLALAEACVAYLVSQRPGTESLADAFKRPSWHQTDPSTARKRILDSAVVPAARNSILSKYKLLDYATLHWTTHLSAARVNASETLVDAAISLLMPPRLSGWLLYYLYAFPSKIPELDESLPSLMDGNATEVASIFGLLPVTRRLFDLRGSHISATTCWMAMSRAARFGDQDMINLLLRRGPIPKPWGWVAVGPVTQAVMRGDIAMVQTLIESGHVDLNFGTGTLCMSPLIQAISHRRLEIVELFCKTDGVLLNQADWCGRTPLLVACTFGDVETARMLLADDRVDVNKADENGNTPIMEACRRGSVELAQLLLMVHTLDVNKADKHDNTPLALALWQGIVQLTRILLVDGRVDVNKTDGKGQHTSRAGV